LSDFARSHSILSDAIFLRVHYSTTRRLTLVERWVGTQHILRFGDQIDMNESSRAKLAEADLQDPLMERADHTVQAIRKEKLEPSAWRVSVRDPLAPSGDLADERSSKIVDSRPRFDSLPWRPVKIAVKSKGKILLISPAEILAVEAEGNYVSLVRQSESHLLRESISTMAEKLRPYHFVRIHRSVLVNASTVEEIYPGSTGEYVLRITGGKQYVVSRTYKNNLKLLAQSWIGIDSFVDD
jgi:DNA-binding LytR/AlgR family response regulator